MNTKQRYGNAVWEAAYEITYSGERGYMPLLSVGEVAKKAGVSKPTAFKYLMECVRLESMAIFPIGKRWVFQIVNKKG